MGVELADEKFRMSELNRFADQKRTIEAFNLLKKHKIKEQPTTLLDSLTR